MKCFHHNDLDGRCAGAVVSFYEKVWGVDDFIEVDYIQRIPTEICEPLETVYFVDYSFKADTKFVLDELLEKGCDIVWIDHHTSSFNLEREFPELTLIKGIREEGTSGAALAYMYFNSCEYKDVPRYIQLVSDYDCWKFELDDTEDFKLGVECWDTSAMSELWEVLQVEGAKEYGKSHPPLLSEIISNGKVIKRHITKENDYYRNSFAYEVEFEGIKMLVVNKKTNSWVFGELYKEYPACCVWVFNGEKYIYSIFSSSPSVDCSKIAEKYGGGGHRGAAGFTSLVQLF